MKNFKSITQFIFALLIATHFIGCSGGGGGGINISNLMVGDDCQRLKLPASCCTNGIRNSTVGQCADPTTAAQPPIRGSMYMAAAMAGSSAVATENANQLVGNGPESQTGKNQLAAMASNYNTIQTQAPKAVNPDNSKPPSNQAKADLFNKINDVLKNGEGDSYAGGKGSGAATALEAAPSQGKATEVAGAGGNQPHIEFQGSPGMAKSKGTPQQLAAVGSGLGGSGFGRDANIISTPEKPSMEANLDEGKAIVAPMLGLDPEDYFTRSDLKDNLFKIIEKQYRKKAESWIAVELQKKTPNPKN